MSYPKVPLCRYCGLPMARRALSYHEALCREKNPHGRSDAEQKAIEDREARWERQISE